MSTEPEPFFTSGIVFLLAILIIVSGLLSALILNPPGDDTDNDDWEPTPHQPYIEPLFSGVLAEHFVEKQLDFGYRIPGTLEHDECRDFIRDTMEEFGYTVEYQNFTKNGMKCANIIARSSPQKEYYPESEDTTNHTLVLGAHYDTRPYSEKDPEVNAPIMGANDGASGVAVLLELARVLSVHPVNYDIEFVFFDLEDHGDRNMTYCIGSEIYAQSLTGEKKERIKGAIVVDMIGDSDLDIYYENNSDPEMREDIWNEAAKLDHREFHKSEKYNMFDDHKRLIDVGVPSVLLIDFDYPHWHTQNDTMDKVSKESMEKIGQVLERYIYRLSGYDKLLAVATNLHVPAGEELVLSGGVHHVDGDIQVNGTLKLRNTMLIVNGEREHEHSLTISGNGSLEVENSIITAPTRSTIFQVMENGQLDVRNSLIEQLWGDTTQRPYVGGILLYSTQFSFY